MYTISTSTFMGFLVGAAQIILGTPGDLPETVKNIHEKGFVPPEQAPSMFIVSAFSITAGEGRTQVHGLALRQRYVKLRLAWQPAARQLSAAAHAAPPESGSSPCTSDSLVTSSAAQDVSPANVPSMAVQLARMLSAEAFRAEGRGQLGSSCLVACAKSGCCQLDRSTVWLSSAEVLSLCRRQPGTGSRAACAVWGCRQLHGQARAGLQRAQPAELRPAGHDGWAGSLLWGRTGGCGLRPSSDYPHALCSWTC